MTTGPQPYVQPSYPPNERKIDIWAKHTLRNLTPREQHENKCFQSSWSLWIMFTDKRAKTKLYHFFFKFLLLFFSCLIFLMLQNLFEREMFNHLNLWLVKVANWHISFILFGIVYLGRLFFTSSWLFSLPADYFLSCHFPLS